MTMLDDSYWPKLLRRFRVREGLTQTAAASLLGVDQTTVSRWERSLDSPSISMRRRLRDLFRHSVTAHQDHVVRARVRHAAWPTSLVGPGAVFLEINLSAMAEARLPQQELRGRSIYGAFGPGTDAVTEQWERMGIFQGELALTISLNVLGDADSPVFLRTMDSPHFTTDGEVWCLCEIRRIEADEYHRLHRDFGGSTFSLPFDALHM